VRENITHWDLGDLPREWRLRQAGTTIVAYPALADRGETAAITLCDYPGEARAQHRLGALRLLRLGGAQQVKYLRKQLLRGNDCNLALAAAGLARDALVEDLIDASYLRAAGLDQELPYSEESFTRQESTGKRLVIERASDIEGTVRNVLSLLAVLRPKMAALASGKWSGTYVDASAQLARLLQGSFLRDTPADWLAQYPRYLKALQQRVERVAGQYAKDQKYAHLLQALAQPLLETVAQRPNLLLLSSEAATYRWMLEEFRVSLFAQNLGTRQAVSEKRLREQWVYVSQWLDGNPH
jgi:ATP-dependent helicase HrpA